MPFLFLGGMRKKEKGSLWVAEDEEGEFLKHEVPGLREDIEKKGAGVSNFSGEKEEKTKKNEKKRGGNR